jgi:hypothetical protein
MLPVHAQLESITGRAGLLCSWHTVVEPNLNLLVQQMRHARVGPHDGARTHRSHFVALLGRASAYDCRGRKAHLHVGAAEARELEVAPLGDRSADSGAVHPADGVLCAGDRRRQGAEVTRVCRCGHRRRDRDRGNYVQQLVVGARAAEAQARCARSALQRRRVSRSPARCAKWSAFPIEDRPRGGREVLVADGGLGGYGWACSRWGNQGPRRLERGRFRRSVLTRSVGAA